MSKLQVANRQMDQLFNPKEFPPFQRPNAYDDKLDSLIAAKSRKDELDKKYEEKSRREKERNEKRALAAKDRRKKQCEAIQNIKKTLAIPLSQRLEEARVKRENERIPAISVDLRMSDASGRPAGPRIATGGFLSAELDLIDASWSNSEGEYLEQSKSEDGAGSDADYKEGDSDRKFHAQLDVDASFNQRVMCHVIEEYFTDIGVVTFPDSIIYCPEDAGGTVELRASVCKLCAATIPVVDLVERNEHLDAHIIGVHGDESEPGHDERFGNVIIKMSNRLIREDRKRASASKTKRLPLEQFLNSERQKIVVKETEAAKLGLVKGPYIYDKELRRGVQSWIPAKKLVTS